MRIALVVPHIFMQDQLLDQLIFAPAALAISLADGLVAAGHDVTLASPGPVKTKAQNMTTSLAPLEDELKMRGYGTTDLLQKHPMLFVSLARQIQSALIADVYERANRGEFDIVHIYTNEEDIALHFARFCRVPVVFTHHDPFDLYIRYKHVFPVFKDLPFISLSDAQRSSMPADTNWRATVYNALPADLYTADYVTPKKYVAFLGRIIASKGVHLAIKAVLLYNERHPHAPLTLKIAGKHYANNQGDTYWTDVIEPLLQEPYIEYEGFIKSTEQKQAFLGAALGLLVPSTFEEPFGMVTIEALACGTPVIGLSRGASSELIKDRENGYIVDYADDESKIVENLANALEKLDALDRKATRKSFEVRFTIEKMVEKHLEVYEKLVIDKTRVL